MAQQDAALAVVLARLESVNADIGEIRVATKEMAVAINRLAVIEERQAATNDALGRAFKELDGVRSRVGVLERDQPIQRQSSDWVQSGVKYLVAIVLGAFLSGIVRAPIGTIPATPAATTGSK